MLQAIATRLEANAISLEAIAIRLEAIAGRLEATAIRSPSIAVGHGDDLLNIGGPRQSRGENDSDAISAAKLTRGESHNISLGTSKDSNTWWKPKAFLRLLGSASL